MTAAKRFGLTGQLRRIVEAAERDDDRVSMMTLSPKGRAGPDNELAVVVIKGDQVIEVFRRWARSHNRLGDGDSGMVDAIENVRVPR